MRANREALLAGLSALLVLAGSELAFRLSALCAGLEAEDMFQSRTRHLAALPSAPDLVVLGNSRVRHGLDTAALEEGAGRLLGRPVQAWNYGMGGVTGWSILSTALRVLDQPRPPAVALILLAPTDLVEATPPELRALTWSTLWRPGDLGALLRAGVGLEDALTAVASASLTGLRHRTRLLQLAGLGPTPGPPLGPPLPPDRRGFKDEEPMPPEVQRARAVRRAAGYRDELVGAHVRLSDEKFGCVAEAVRRLEGAGARVALVLSPASEPVARLADEPGSRVPEIAARLEALAAERGVPFLDHTRPPVLTDADFTDGDHLNRLGARRYSLWLIEQLGPAFFRATQAS
jgi:hypothetical protein